MNAAETEQRVLCPESIRAEIAAYLRSHPRTRHAAILCYGQILSSSRQEITEWIASCMNSTAQNMSIEVVPGEEWNHFRYQAAVQREDTLHVVLVPNEYRHRVEGISTETIHGNTRMLHAIARATYETLIPNSLYFRVNTEFAR